jgi:nucleotide-binding universal stress UspA family protein
MKILLPVDGSEYSRRAANYVAQHATWLKEMPEVHMLHVHAPIPYPGAAAAAGKGAIESYQRDESQAALAICEKELSALSVPAKSSWCVGEVVDEVAKHVDKHGIDLIVVGSHGRGAVTSMALGSITLKLLATLKTPVLVVR